MLEVPVAPEPLLLNPERHVPRVGITHHLVDFDNPKMDLGDNGGFFHISEKRHNEGVDSQRFDIRIEKITPDANSKPDAAYIKRAARLANLGHKAGLEYTPVLSTAPKWMLELAKKDPPAFVEAYKKYIDAVFSELAQNGGSPPAEIQIFNELNMKNYTPDALLPRIKDCVEVVKQKSQEYFGKDIPLVATLQVSEPVSLKRGVPFFVDSAIDFMHNHQNILSLFDKIKLDYYPGIWHTPTETLNVLWQNRDYLIKAFKTDSNTASIESFIQTQKVPMDMFRKMFGNMDLLRKALIELKPYQDAGRQIGIGEIGMPTIKPLEKFGEHHEKLQTLALSIVSWKLRPLIEEFHLSNVDIYQGVDEPVPEVGFLNWGFITKKGKPKYIEGALEQLIKRIKAPYEPIQTNPSKAS